MAFFVFCVNLLAAAFVLTFAAEIFFLLVGSIVFAYKVLNSKGRKGTASAPCGSSYK